MRMEQRRQGKKRIVTPIPPRVLFPVFFSSPIAHNGTSVIKEKGGGKTRRQILPFVPKHYKGEKKKRGGEKKGRISPFSFRSHREQDGKKRKGREKEKAHLSNPGNPAARVSSANGSVTGEKGGKRKKGKKKNLTLPITRANLELKGRGKGKRNREEFTACPCVEGDGQGR